MVRQGSDARVRARPCPPLPPGFYADVTLSQQTPMSLGTEAIFAKDVS